MKNNKIKNDILKIENVSYRYGDAKENEYVPVLPPFE